MFQALSRSVKQFLTALVLLLLAVVGLELLLQIKTEAPVSTVSSRAKLQWQPLLAPSAVTHHEMRRLYKQQDSGTGLTISTNSLGLRGDQPAIPKPADVFRVLVLGDDTVLGAELPTEETVSARLQTFLQSATQRQVEVLNAGVPGFSPLLSWLQFQHELKKLKPDLVVLHFDMTDVADDSAYRSMLRDSGTDQICSNPLLFPDRHAGNPLIRLMRNSSLCQLFKSNAGALTGERSQAMSSALFERYEWTAAANTDLRLLIQHALSPLTQFQRDSQIEGYRLIVTTSPVPWQVASGESFPGLSEQISATAVWPETEDLPYQILQAACDKDGIPFCNSTDAFRGFSQPEKLFLGDSPELSKYGALLYAREIASMLLKTPDIAGLTSGGPAAF
ncbi:MAG: SGNH/GDSL hydrolase family protein [Fuerstiella sp.]